MDEQHARLNFCVVGLTIHGHTNCALGRHGKTSNLFIAYTLTFFAPFSNKTGQSVTLGSALFWAPDLPLTPKSE
jgi:hypothetical protein